MGNVFLAKRERFILFALLELNVCHCSARRRSKSFGACFGVSGGQLSQNWGLLVALNSGAEAQIIDEPFSQMDVAITVLDYLGLADRGRHFFGRS